MPPAPEDSAAQRAYAHIRAAVLAGDLPVGAMLGESGLAAEIGVSRTPVRAALSRLQDEGWISIYPKRGALVRGMSEQAVADLAEARQMLESTGVSLATESARARFLPLLQGEVAAQRAALQAEDLKRFVESTIQFHRSFVEMGGNGIILELNDRLGDRQRYLLNAHGERLLARRSEILLEHEALVAAVAEGDHAAFGAALRAHIGDTHRAELRAG